MSEEKIENNHYYKHLKEKSLDRCLLLLIPIIGNLVFAILDFKYKAEANNPQRVGRNHREIDQEERNREFFLELVRRPSNVMTQES